LNQYEPNSDSPANAAFDSRVSPLEHGNYLAINTA